MLNHWTHTTPKHGEVRHRGSKGHTGWVIYMMNKDVRIGQQGSCMTQTRAPMTIRNTISIYSKTHTWAIYTFPSMLHTVK